MSRHKREKHAKRRRINEYDVDLSHFNNHPTLIEELQSVRHFLRDDKVELNQKIIYNFKLFDLDAKFIDSKLDQIFNELPCTAKINFSFGFVLQNIQEEDSYRYYYAANNNPVFTHPVVLGNDADLSFIKHKVDGNDYFENMCQHRPDTKWKFFSVTNVTFFVYL